MIRSASHPSPAEARAIGRRGVLMLFFAMAMAVAAGLLSWGPILLEHAARRHAVGPLLDSASRGMNILGHLALLSAGAWGIGKTRSIGRRPATVAPWTWLYGSLIGLALAQATDDVASSIASFVAVQFFAANCAGLMLLCLLAERIDVRFGLHRYSVSACATASAAVASWFVGASVGGFGDARALLFIHGLPILLMAAGALSLAGRPRRTANWAAMLLLWTAAQGFAIADEHLLQWTGGINGHATMQLAFAWSAARSWQHADLWKRLLQSQRRSSS